MLDDAIESALVGYPTSAAVSTIASYTTELALASGGYAKAADISSAITTSAIPKNTPFSTIVSGCTLTLAGGTLSAELAGHSFQLTSDGVIADGSEYVPPTPVSDAEFLYDDLTFESSCALL